LFGRRLTFNCTTAAVGGCLKPTTGADRLATHPTDPIFVTASDDRSVRLWNSDTHTLIAMTRLKHEARSAAFSHGGTEVAIGMKRGRFTVLHVSDLEPVQQIHDLPRKRVIHELK
jgi:WD40 repeat protein